MEKGLKHYNNAFDLFNFDTTNYLNVGLCIPQISASCIEGVLGGDFEDIYDFIIQCGDGINKILGNEINSYNCYLFIRLKISDNNRIDNYMKVWKKIKKQYVLDGMKLGPEILVENNKNYYYVSIAQISLEDINNALFIQFNNLHNSFIFISNKNNILNEYEIEKIFNLSFSDKLPNILPYTEYINYYMLFSQMCNDLDYIIRLSTTSEELGMEIFYTKVL